MRGGPRLTIYADLDALGHAAADLFVRMSLQAQADHEQFRVALSGGSTPRTLHTLLAAAPYRERVNWSHIEFFWGDERTVPPDDPESNYRMARETLLDRVPVRPEGIHPMPTQLGDPAATAAHYSDELRAAFALGEDDLPRFDLIFLGMGPDGHTASLFPHTAALRATDKLVVANAVPRLQTFRITLTASVINHAAAVAFLVSGADKAPALAAVLEGAHAPDEYPAQLIAPTDGDLYWLIDRAAATQLTQHG
ncbi:MAG: 6-phosphogluconolactonase [Ktedonobacterales bacterium]|nr:6-phosphogluconolactonase [Ktedonobacterales bacterium]